MNKKHTILIVDDIPNNIAILYEHLSKNNFRVMVAKDGESAIKQCNVEAPDLILLDIMMPGLDGFQTCDKLKSNNTTKNIPIIFMSSLHDTYDKVHGFEIGAVDYITKPIQQEEVLARIKTHLTLKNLQNELADINSILEEKIEFRTKELKETNLKLEQEIKVRKETEKSLKETLLKLEKMKNKVQMENVYLQEEIKLDHNFDEIITQSKSMENVLQQIEQVAITDSTVLLLGETGTGKELIARAINNISNRRNTTLVKVNCAALPSNLIESELFGHEKGAFTGAYNKKIGKFELADQGTLFLDEIGDLPIDLQVKLLRVLQEEEIERLGSNKYIKVDVRIIAATNVNLEEHIKKGKFRQDLFYRLNVFPINIPPLRDRKGDVKLLVNHFVKKYCKKFNKKITKIPNNILNSLEEYHWQGNVRELENIIERAVILTPDDKLFIDLPITKHNAYNLSDSTTSTSDEPIPKLKEVVKSHIIKALEHSNWVIDGKNGASKLLGLPPSTLRDKMKKHSIRRPKQ